MEVILIPFNIYIYVISYYFKLTLCWEKSKVKESLNKCISNPGQLKTLNKTYKFMMVFFFKMAAIQYRCHQRINRQLNKTYEEMIRGGIFEIMFFWEYFGRLIATGEWGVCLLSSCKVRYPQNKNILKNSSKVKMLSLNI